MSQSSSPTSPNGSQGIAQAIGVIGLLWVSFVVLFAIVLPFFWSPILKLPLYQTIKWALLSGAVFGPLLLIGGFFWSVSPSPSRLFRVLARTLGVQLLFFTSIWAFYDAIQIYQKGWGVLRLGLQIPFTFKSFLWGPGLMALGFVLATQSALRNQAGILLTTLAYQALTALGLLVFYLKFAANVVPMFAKRMPAAKQTDMLGLVLLIAALVFLCYGLILTKPGLRLRSHLVLSSPLWVPFFVIFFFWSLVVDTTFYFIDELLHVQLQPPTWLKILVAPLCLVFFPLLLTIDFSIGLMRLLGHSLLMRMFPPEEHLQSSDDAIAFSPWRTYGLGALLLCTLPLWLLPALIYVGVRLFIYESILLQLTGRAAFEHIPEEPKP